MSASSIGFYWSFFHQLWDVKEGTWRSNGHFHNLTQVYQTPLLQNVKLEFYNWTQIAHRLNLPAVTLPVGWPASAPQTGSPSETLLPLASEMRVDNRPPSLFPFSVTSLQGVLKPTPVPQTLHLCYFGPQPTSLQGSSFHFILYRNKQNTSRRKERLGWLIISFVACLILRQGLAM